MNPFYDPSKSTSSKIKNCGLIQSSNNRCFFRQSYSEGSSWHAFKVSDRVYIGGKSSLANNYDDHLADLCCVGENFADIPGGANYSVDFEFGCQDYETGLFRTQYVDGIMGLSASDETLPFQLFKNKIINTKVFALCFRLGGGILTIGGVDPSMHYYTDVSHSKRSSSSNINTIQSQILFAKLLKPKGWYTVNMMDIMMINPADGSLKSIGGPIFKSLGSKGTIVDSGTTDTYLPSALASNFKALFQSITKLAYENKVMKLTSHQYMSLPTIVYRFEGVDGTKSIDIKVYPHSYMEKHSAESYTPRIYLTESIGAVLGSNFINEYNTIFDIDRMRVGFARSNCIPPSQASGSH